MKKFLLIAFFAIIALNANAFYIYTSWCGKQCQTVPPEYFNDPDTKQWFYDELDKDLCGSSKDDDTDHPAPTDEDDGNRP